MIKTRHAFPEYCIINKLNDKRDWIESNLIIIFFTAYLYFERREQSDNQAQ